MGGDILQGFISRTRLLTHFPVYEKPFSQHQQPPPAAAVEVISHFGKRCKQMKYGKYPSSQL
jgi:hypothetical protein